MELDLINWWAVLAAAVAYMALGSLWYGPLFGKLWMGLVGITPESMKQMPLTPIQAMVGGFVTAFITATALSYASIFFMAVSAVDAVILAFWMWLGFVATTQAGSYLWEGRPLSLFMLNAAHSLLALVIMAIIVVLWV